MASWRREPVVGMAVDVIHLGAVEEAVVEEVLDGGRTVVVAGSRYTLRPLTGRFVREDEPYYGVWLALRGGG